MKKTIIVLLLAIALVSVVACSGGKAGPAAIGDEIDLGKYVVKFTATKSDKTFDEKDVVHLYFDFTNKSGETISSSHALRINAFQNGVQLTGVQFIDDTGEGDKATKAVKDGATINNVRITFYVEDTSDITLEVSEYVPIGKQPKPADVVIPIS
ncbi:MAG TPA: DUF5067 domain-containing protein [Clostridiaceae bacterium]|nr:DUF5067 domain-containing protein [Clostridiaceae bacterium]